VETHGGEVPPDMDQLVALDGVGRKTANVVLGSAFGLARELWWTLMWRAWPAGSGCPRIPRRKN